VVVAAWATAIFLSPIAPVNTSNEKATTVRHLYMTPPDGKLTRRDYMYYCSLMEQKCYFVSKRSIPSDNVPSVGSCLPVRSSFVRIVYGKSRIRDRRGQRYISTTRTSP
jgi:hypothetical protein